MGEPEEEEKPMFQDEIEKLMAQIDQEKQATEILHQSTEDFKGTIEDLTAELKALDEDQTEDQWKERFNEQQEMNSYLEKQILILQEKLKEFKGEMANSGSKSDDPFEIDESNEVELRRLIKQLEREKLQMTGTLKDLEWQLDSESKARDRINADIGEYRAGLAETQGKPAIPAVTEIRPAKYKMTPDKHINNNNFRGLRQGTTGRYYGIPDNQRIIDPRKGPVKRTAAAGHLPKIDSRDGKKVVKTSPGAQKPEPNYETRAYNSAKERREKYRNPLK